MDETVSRSRYLHMLLIKETTKANGPDRFFRSEVCHPRRKGYPVNDLLKTTGEISCPSRAYGSFYRNRHMTNPTSPDCGQGEAKTERRLLEIRRHENKLQTFLH